MARPRPKTEPLAWEAPVAGLSGVGPRRAELLGRLGLGTVGELLLHLPRDWRRLPPRRAIAELREGEEALVIGRFSALRVQRGRGRRGLVGEVEDATGRIAAVWFGRTWGRTGLKRGDRVALAGKMSRWREAAQLVNPEIFPLAEGQAAPSARPRAVYPATAGLPQGVLRRLIAGALARVLAPADPVPPAALAEAGLPDLAAALRGAHQPRSLEEGRRARRRLVFSRLFTLSAAMAWRRQELRRPGLARPIGVPEGIHRRIRELLPFRLTAGQEKALAEILGDLAGDRPMHRLLVGDVGSGKTAVAFYAALAVAAAGGQAALMVPTEVLARQHFAALGRLLNRQEPAGHLLRAAGGRGIAAALLCGGQGAAAHREVRAGLAAGTISLVVGTHALAWRGVSYRRLDLAVVDEQHRFGVRQRARLGARQDARRPHLLAMSATPIPRSLALTLYGDLDLSVIADRPPGRAPVETCWLRTGDRARWLGWVKDEVARGRRAFVVYPVIRESNRADLAAAERGARELARALGPRTPVALLHGALPPAAREKALADFRRGTAPVLVATTIVEVGLDVPEATLMIVEDPERFGLSQLHQLRGRIGRGPWPGRFVLAGAPRAPQARARLEALTRCADGFKLAEEDLRQRGPGELLGFRQQGLFDLDAADLSGDARLVEEACALARQAVAADPGFAAWPPLGEAVRRRHAALAALAGAG